VSSPKKPRLASRPVPGAAVCAPDDLADGAATSPLELSGPTFAAMIDLVKARLVRHLGGLEAAPMHRNRGARKAARALREGMPEEGTSFEPLLEQLFSRALPLGLNTASAGYLAYIPGGGLLHAAIADLITSAVNRYVGVWIAAPGLVEIEASVVRWLAGVVGLPEGAGGVLTTGGSMANLLAIVAARRDRLPTDFSRGVLYVSREVHHSVTKAAIVAGFPAENVRSVPTCERQRMRVDALVEAIARDRAEGLSPFLVVGSAGTTNTGAVDPLGALADVAEREALWLHVDAAYGGFFALTERGRAALAGIERAHSVTLDPHKGLFLPYGTGCVVVRDPTTLRRAFSSHASYLPDMQRDADLIDFCELSPELSREPRGLRVWLPLKMHGARAFRAALDEKLDLARYAAETLGAWPEVAMVAPPTLSLLAFRFVAPGRSPAEADALSRRVMRGVNARQRVLLTGTTVDDRFVLRMCVLSFRTHRPRIDAALADLRASLDAALSAR